MASAIGDRYDFGKRRQRLPVIAGKGAWSSLLIAGSRQNAGASDLREAIHAWRVGPRLQATTPGRYVRHLTQVSLCQPSNTRNRQE